MRCIAHVCIYWRCVHIDAYASRAMILLLANPRKDADARRYFLLTDLDTSDIHCRMVERTRSMVEHEIDDTLREHLVSGAGDGPAGRAWMA